MRRLAKYGRHYPEIPAPGSAISTALRILAHRSLEHIDALATRVLGSAPARSMAAFQAEKTPARQPWRADWCGKSVFSRVCVSRYLLRVRVFWREPGAATVGAECTELPGGTGPDCRNFDRLTQDGRAIAGIHSRLGDSRPGLRYRPCIRLLIGTGKGVATTRMRRLIRNPRPWHRFRDRAFLAIRNFWWVLDFCGGWRGMGGITYRSPALVE